LLLLLLLLLIVVVLNLFPFSSSFKTQVKERSIIKMKIDEVASTTKKARVATHTHIKVFNNTL